MKIHFIPNCIVFWLKAPKYVCLTTYLKPHQIEILKTQVADEFNTLSFLPT